MALPGGVRTLVRMEGEAVAAWQRQEAKDRTGGSELFCLLALEGRGVGVGPLPPSLFSQEVAPFLRFSGPQPGQLYALGGRDQQQEPLDTVEMFDTWHGRWVSCPRMLSRRAGCAAAALPDGRLLVAGGYDERGIAEGLLASCEAFDPARQCWTLEPIGLARARWGHGCAVLPDGTLLAVGGCSLPLGAPPDEALMETLRGCESLDPHTGIWAPCAELHVARAGARVVSAGSRYIAAVGGCDDVFGRAELLRSVELFDAQNGRWTLLEPRLSVPRTTAAVAALDDRRILVVGGTTSAASGEVYEGLPGADTEGAKAGQLEAEGGRLQRPPVCNLTEGRMGCQAVVLNLPAPGKSYPLCTRPCVVVVGGENGDEDLDSGVRQFSSVPVYDVEADEWRPEWTFPPLPTPRTAMALVVGPGLITGHP